MPSRTFPGGMKAMTFPRPGARFKPLHADEEARARFGFARRPRDPGAVPAWHEHLRRALHYVEPVFHYRRRKRRDLPPVVAPEADLLPVALETLAAPLRLVNWSGGILTAPPGQRFRAIVGQWSVPNPYPTTQDGSWAYCASWLGIDGFGGSQDVVQVGVECDAKAGTSDPQRHIYPWFAWAPGYEIGIDSFPVSAGDTLSYELDVQSDTIVICRIQNRSSGRYTQFRIVAPGGTTLTGNCAEWIVERPKVGGVVSHLADYGVIHFSEARATTDAGSPIPVNSGQEIVMVDGQGAVLSTGSIAGAGLLKCSFQRT